MALRHKNCVFCGRPLAHRRSREHIIPQWLQQHLKLTNQPLFDTRYTLEGRRDLSYSRQFTFHGHVSGLVCRDCNNGWLNDLENQARPHLIPLFDGTQQDRIPFNACQIISKWLFKTALTLHSVMSPDDMAIPDEHYASFYRDLSIPPGSLIAAAPYNARADHSLYYIQNEGWMIHAKGKAFEDARRYFEKSYKITVHLGQFAWRVTYFPIEKIPNTVFLFEYRQDAVAYIYPFAEHGVRWPPGASIDDLGEFDTSLGCFEKLPAVGIPTPKL